VRLRGTHGSGEQSEGHVSLKQLTIHQHHAGTLSFTGRILCPTLVLALILGQGLVDGQGALASCRKTKIHTHKGP
jgi:hypothetical protein